MLVTPVADRDAEKQNHSFRVRQKQRLRERGWEGGDTGVIIHSSNFNASPTMSYGVLECDIVMAQNCMLMIL